MKIICEDAGGNRLILGWFPPLWLRSVEGLGADYNVYTAKFGTQDGEYYAGSSAKMRNIVLVLDVNKAAEPEQRQRLLTFFPPRSKGTFYYYADDDSPGRKISYYAEKMEPSGDGVLRHFTISLICPDPLFSDLQATQVPMSYWKKLLKFPFTMPGFSGSGNPVTFSGKGCKDTLELLRVRGQTNQTVTAQGKNLFDAQRTPTEIVRAVISDVSAGKFTVTTESDSITYANIRYRFNLTPGAVYTLSVQYTATAPDGGYISAYDSAQNLIKAALSKNTFTVPADGIVCLYFFANTNVAGQKSASFSNIQLELGSTATPYAPFVPNSPSPDYPAPISGVTKTIVNGVDYALPQTLYSLPDGTADQYDQISAMGIQPVGKAIVDGSKNPTWFNHRAEFSCSQITFGLNTLVQGYGRKNSVYCISDTFIGRSSPSTPYTFQIDSNGGLYFENIPDADTGVITSDTSAQAQAKVLAWFAAHITTVLYQLATPVAITDTPQVIPVSTGANTISADAGAVSVRSLGVFKVAERIAEQIVTVYNDTNVAAGLLIYFTARGDVVNPGMMEVRTQKRFQLNTQMMNGDTILVNTNQNEKNAAFQEDPEYVDMWHFGDTWLQLQPGENVFQYFADSGADYLDVKMIYMPRYWGA